MSESTNSTRHGRYNLHIGPHITLSRSTRKRKQEISDSDILSEVPPVVDSASVQHVSGILSEVPPVVDSASAQYVYPNLPPLKHRNITPSKPTNLPPSKRANLLPPLEPKRGGRSSLKERHHIHVTDDDSIQDINEFRFGLIDNNNNNNNVNTNHNNIPDIQVDYQFLNDIDSLLDQIDRTADSTPSETPRGSPLRLEELSTSPPRETRRRSRSRSPSRRNTRRRTGGKTNRKQSQRRSRNRKQRNNRRSRK